MLKQVKIRNYKNFRDEIILSLDTPNNYEFNRKIIKNNIINKTLIVGKNASGKTNLGYAIMDITTHLTDKTRKAVRPYTNLYNVDSIAHFEYVFCFNNSILRYMYEKEVQDIPCREELYIDDKLVLLNDVNNKMVDLSGAENLNYQLYNEKEISLVKYVSSNTILNENEKECRVFIDFIKFVNAMLWFSSTEGHRYIGLVNETGDLLEKILEKDGTPEKLQKFLADLGIYYNLISRDNGDGKTIYCRMGNKEVQLYSLISSGTRSLIFFYLWYLQNEKVSFVYIDEFDAFYHTDLAKAIVKILIDLVDIQTIITTHNTDLISNEILRPDCIFELCDNKIKPFSNLTHKALREAHNLQKMYKAGAFNE